MPSIPPIRPDCSITVAIPAKDESASIGYTLAALAEQRTLDGSAFDANAYEVIVLANDCTDDTAAVVEAFAAENPTFALHVVSITLPQEAAHVGSARRVVLDIALERQVGINGNAGIIASTDADSCADRFWIAHTIAEIEHVDVVAGHVEISSIERAEMERPLRDLYDRELYYRRLLGEVEALYDPRPFDVSPRHNSLVGTSFASRTEVYVRAGRLPVLRSLEDVAFARALQNVDARIRHSYNVRVQTSARSGARVVGGFGTYINHLRHQSLNGDTHRVESGLQTVLRARTRGLLRAHWASPWETTALSEVARLCRSSIEDVAATVDSSLPFGRTWARMEAIAIPFSQKREEPIEDAIRIVADAIERNVAKTSTNVLDLS